MKPGHFIMDGQNSEDLGVVIQDRPLILTPRRRVEFKQAFGMSGTLPFDEMAYDNTPMNLNMFSVGSSENTADMNRSLIYDLFDSDRYIDFIPYFDSGKIYKVMTIVSPTFESKYFYEEGQSFTVELTVKPYKYYVDSPKVTLTTAGNITNPYSKESLPLIKIYGSGDVTLKVNGINFVVKNVTDHIYLDCQAMFAYRDNSGVITNENSKIFTRLYPYLKKGINTISWTGTVSKIEIEPRWRTLA